MNVTTLLRMLLMKMLEAERPGVGPCRTLLVEIAPTISVVRNTSKIQVALWEGWGRKERLTAAVGQLVFSGVLGNPGG